MSDYVSALRPSAPASPRARRSGRPGHHDGLRGRLARAAIPPPDQPWWVRPGLAAVLLLAAVLCLWDLTINGTSNTYYAAAVRSASESWKAWFFGALDPGSFITVDKPPLSIWLMGLSARVFGFGSFSMLLPQALCGIGAVALLFATVRRVFGDAAGLAAAALLAVTPISVAVARVNNPDALLILLMVAAAYFVVRALESARTRHLVLAGALVGLAFMTKMLQGWMIVPALGAVYLLAGRPALLTRVRQLALAGVGMVAVSAAWPLAVTLWPSSKPYIGGSEDGSVWNLILGYNGFGRLTGGEGMGGGDGQGASFGGVPSWLRLFNENVGAQIAWLLPLAGLSLVAGLWLTRRAARTDLARAGWGLFGVWALVHLVIFSKAQGTFHPYYVSAMAPAVAALVGGGVVALARAARRSWFAYGALAAGIGGTAWMAVALLGRTPDFAPWLRVAIPVAAGVAILAAAALRFPAGRGRAALMVALVAGTFAIAAGPASYSVASVERSLNGNNVLAGPASVGQGGGGMGMGGGPGGGAMRGTPPAGAPGQSSTPESGSGATGQSSAPESDSAGMPAGGAAGASGPGGPGGGGSVSDELVAYLQAHRGDAKYLLAASGSQTTAPIIIETGEAVVTIGGFTGSDPAPTADQLAQMVADGELRYVLLSDQGGRGGPGSTSTALQEWVQEHGTVVDDVETGARTLYLVSAS